MRLAAAASRDRALSLLEDCRLLPGSRCFVWVHYQDPHGPYDPPGDRRERLLPAERADPGGDQRLPLGADHQGLGAIPRYQYLDDRNDVAFYQGKIASAQFFAKNVLPASTLARKMVEASSLDIMELPEEVF